MKTFQIHSKVKPARIWPLGYVIYECKWSFTIGWIHLFYKTVSGKCGNICFFSKISPFAPDKCQCISRYTVICNLLLHDDVIKWKHFPRNWPFVRGIHRSRWIPHTKASDAELWCFFDLRLHKRLSKQQWGWWFEPPSWSLWRHRNEKLWW